ncbi:MAG: CCA tRNA nucleotidyltransferase [Paracoccaceae bacterium]
MTRVGGGWIERAETQAVCRMLTDAGYHALFVGGCVRNALLDHPVSDIDISTEARPERVVALAEAAGLKPVPTGIEHGTITVVADGLPHEVTTFRRDVETFGRRAVVAFTDRLEEDARRRDFTMNALYARPDGTVIDPLDQGRADLAARRVRFIDDPKDRIAEDFLRILRFFRFHAWFGDPAAGLDAEGLAACAELSDGLEGLSRERIGAEMTKLLSAPDPAPAVAAMAQSGCLIHAIHGADATALPVLVHLEQEAGLAPDPIRRLAVLGGQDVARRLRLSRQDARRLQVLRDGIGSGADAPELAYRHGADMALDVLLLRSALMGVPLPDGVRDALDLGAGARFPVTARDLMPAYQGAALGERLAELETRWIASGFRLTRQELLS